MKRIASNVLILPNGELLSMQVVELGDHGTYNRHYDLCSEQAGTIWIGGVLFLVPKNIEPLQNEKVNDILKRIDNDLNNSPILHVWHANGLDVSNALNGLPIRWALL